MERGEFLEEMGRLYNTFGKRSFSEERMGLIWYFVKDLTRFEFKKTINHLLCERYSPLPLDFREKANHILRQRPKEEIESVDCDECSHGFVVVEKDNLLYAFKCHCKLGVCYASGLPLVPFHLRKQVIWK